MMVRMGRSWVVPWVLLVCGCQNVFGVKEVVGDGATSGITFEKSWSAMTGIRTIPTALVNFAEPPADHDLIVVVVAWWHNVPTMVTDNTGMNQYVVLPTTTLSPGGSNLWLYYAYDIVSAPQFSITVVSTPASGGDVGNDELTVVAHDYRGTGTSDGLDGQQAANADGSTAPVVSDCNTITASQSDVMVAALTRDFNGSTSVSDGWNLRASVDAPHDSFMVLATADRMAGPETADPTFTSMRTNGGYSWGCLLASFH